MLVRTLGVLELEDGDLRRPKPLLLLTYLALEGRQSRQHVSELFWLRASNPLASLSTALTQLRKAAPHAVEADDDHVGTSVRCDAVTLKAALREGDLARALDLYRGPFLGGLHLRGWGLELEEWVVSTRELLAARLRLALIDAAEQAGARERFDEAGSQAETALRLVGAPPLEPRDMIRVHHILTASRSPTALDLRSEAAELDIELSDSVEHARARLRNVPIEPAPNNLPTRYTSFVGRRRELADLQKRLRDDTCRLLTVLGPGGVGKSRLASRSAHAMLASGAFPDGIYLVSLDFHRPPDSLTTAICDALDLDPSAEAGPLVAITDFVAAGETLLILDGMEHLSSELDALPALLGACANLTIMVTSRERLNLLEEHVFPVGGLAVPEEGTIEPAEAMGFDAIELFVRRAKRSRPGFELTSTELPAVTRICQQVAGLPLAIELSAVWIRALSASDIADELTAGLGLLSTPVRNVDARHSSMNAAIEHSWRSLASGERSIMRLLATFRGGFSRDAAFAVAGASIDVIASLVDKSLLRRGENRYDLHPLIQRFTAAKLLEQRDEWIGARRHHAEYFGAMVSQWRDRTLAGDGNSALSTFRVELENVREGWSFYMEQENWPALSRLAGPLRTLFDLSKRFRTGSWFFGVAAEAAADSAGADSTVAGVLLKEKAWLTDQSGEHREAAEIALQALRHLDGSDEPLEEGMCRNVLASALWFLGDFSESRSRWREALDLASAVGNTSHVANYSANLALADHALGNYDSARALLEAALQAFAEVQDDFHVVRTLNKLAVLLLDTGDYAAAEVRLRRAVEHASRHEFADEVPQLLVNLGVAAFDGGRFQDAVQLTSEALRTLEGSDDRYLEAYALARLGWAETALGNEAEAIEHFSSALRRGKAIVAIESEVVSGAALLKMNQRRNSEAVRLLAAVEQRDGIEQADRRRYRRLLDALRERMNEESFEAAKRSGNELVLDEVLAGIAAYTPT